MTQENVLSLTQKFSLLFTRSKNISQLFYLSNSVYYLLVHGKKKVIAVTACDN